jgi:GNAT superfamily N-acetyltransferase
MESATAATAEQAVDVVRLATLVRAEVASQRGGPRWIELAPRADIDVASVQASIDDPQELVLVGTIDGVVVGYALARVDETTVAVIDELYVEEPARSVGVAEALMDEILAWARAAGCHGVESFALPGNREMKNLFERYGLVARAILVHRSLEVSP